jgi:hypothetical protein
MGWKRLLLAPGLAGILALARLYGRGTQFTDTHKLAIASGALGFFVMLSLALETGGIRGIGAAGGIAAVLLFMLWLHVRRAQLSRAGRNL